MFCAEAAAQVTTSRIVFADSNSSTKVTVNAQTGASSSYQIAFPFTNISQGGTMLCFNKSGAQVGGEWVGPGNNGEWMTSLGGVPAWQLHQVWSLAGNSIPAAGTGSGESFVGTTNAKAFILGTVATQPLRFLTNNAEQVSLGSAGDVGIGLAGGAASQRLQLQGNVLLSNAGTASEFRLAEPSGSGTNYTAFRAGIQGRDITYTLPTALPTAANYPVTSDTSGMLSWTSSSSLPSSDSVWKTTGNSATDTGTNFVGTTDYSIYGYNMNFRINNLNTVVYEHSQSSPNITAGRYYENQSNRGNFIDYQTGRGNVIAGGGDLYGGHPTFGGGNRIGIGANFSTISGGISNSISVNLHDATIMGGFFNVVTGYALNVTMPDTVGSTIMGGHANSISMNMANVLGGGDSHMVVDGFQRYSYYNGTFSGKRNISHRTITSIVGGGYLQYLVGYGIIGNTSLGGPLASSVIAGGYNNILQGGITEGHVIMGGSTNTINVAIASTISRFGGLCIGGGHNNLFQTFDNSYTPAISASTISGGGEHYMPPILQYGTISGGYQNQLISLLGFQGIANFSAIPGGQYVTVSLKGTFAFSGQSSTPAVVLQPSSTSIGAFTRTAAAFTDVNLLLGNVDGTARELVFAEPNTSKTYTGTHFTSFRAQAQTADINYTLPAARGTGGSNYVFADLSGTGALSWPTAASVATNGAWSLTGNPITSGGVGGQFIGTTAGNSQPFVLATNGTERMRITSTGAIVTQHDTAIGIRMNNTATSSTASTTKRGLEILSTGVWDGAASTNIGLRSTVTGGTTNIAARFLSAPMESEQQINLTGTAWNGGFGTYVGSSGSNGIAFAATSATPQSILFFTGNNGAAERMRVSASGGIGIGVTAPSSPLEVAGTGTVVADATAMRVQTTATSGTSSIIKTGLDLQSTGTWNGTNATNIGLNVDLSGGTVNYPALFAGGRVGIGYTHTVTPAEDWLMLNTQSGGKTASFTATQVQNSATSSSDGIIKIGLDIASTGTWDGTSARNIGLRSSVSGGATNIAAQFLGGNITTNSRVIFTGTPWNGATGVFVGTTTSQPLVVATTNATAQPIQFFTGANGANERMRIAETGEVGIGITNPSWALDVLGDGAKTTAFTAARVNNSTTTATASIDKIGLDIQSTGTWDDGNAATVENNVGLSVAATSGQNNYDGVFTGGSVGVGTTTPGTRLSVAESGARVIAVNRTGSDGVLMEFFRSGTSVGDITVATGTVSYNAFTGSHYAIADRPIEKGTLVSMTGNNQNASGLPSSEIIYGIAPTSKANDPAVLGAYLSVREPEQASSKNNPSLVMAVGNGEMWVTNLGGDIHAGDYLISSSVPGCAMRDAGMFDTSYVVARAAENIDWDAVENDPALDGAKRKKISVFFESFVKMNNRVLKYQALDLAQKIKTQQVRIKKLQEYVSRIR